jgi:hypothetical protein
VVFRRRYFTSRAALQRALDGFMHYYNTERPHQGYRPRSNSSRARLGRGDSAVISFTTLERRKCQHRFESGHTRGQSLDADSWEHLGARWPSQSRAVARPPSKARGDRPGAVRPHRVRNVPVVL